MAENMFERFRPAASPEVSADNPFKQFAARPTPNAATPSTPVAKKPERTWGEAAKDTALGIGQGVVNILGGLSESGEAMQPTGIARSAVGLARRVVPSINLPNIPTTVQVAENAAAAIQGREANQLPTAAEAFGAATNEITSKLSPALQAEKQELADTEGFLASAKKVVTSPRLLSQFTAEQVPNLATLGQGSRMAAASAVEGVVARAIAGGATKEAAEALGRAAAKEGAEKFIVGANVAMESGSAAQQAQQDALQLPDEVWQANDQYKAKIAAGVDPLTAKRDLSQDTALVGRLVGAASGFLGGKIAAPFEADVFTRTLARRPVAVLQGAVREAAEEAVQEGGSQIGANLGVGQIDPNRGVFEGVPEAAGTGAALGGIMGGGLALGGAAASKPATARPQPTVQPAGPLTRAADPAAVDVVVPAARPFPAARPGSISDVANLVPAAPPPLPEPPPLPTAKEEAAAARAQPDNDNPAEPGYVRVADEFPQQKWQLDSIDARLREAKKAGDQDGVAKALQEKQDYRVSVLRTDTIHSRIDHLKDKDTGEAKFELRALNAELDKRRAVSTESSGSSTDSEPVSTENGASAPVSAAVAPPPPWVDPETGVMREPADREIEEVMHGLINQAAGGSGINSHVMRKVLVDQMGLKPDRINPLMKKVKADRKKGLTAPVDFEQQLLDQVQAAARARAARSAIDPSVVEATADPAQSAAAATAPVPPPLPAASSESAAPPSAEYLPLPAAEAPLSADLPSAPADPSIPDTSLPAQPQSDASGSPTYDETVELLASDITTPSGGSFASRDAAELTAKRHEGAKVFPLDDGTFTVRKPAVADTTLQPPAEAASAAGQETSPVVAPAESVPQPTSAAVEARSEAAGQAENAGEGSLPSVQSTPAAEPAQPATLDEVAHTAATSDKNDLPAPTEAQKEAGNYKKGHVRLAGLDISIENPAGSRRRPEWPPLKNHYGYFKGSVGADKDHVDVFMTDRADDATLPVFVVDQRHKNGKFDEHKVVMGAANEAEARATYLGNYAKGWGGLQAITQMTQDEFKAWVKDPTKTTKPAAGKANSGRAIVSPKPSRAAVANDPITPSVKLENAAAPVAPQNGGAKRKEAVAQFSRAGRAGSDRTAWGTFPDVDIASPFGPGLVRLSSHPEYAAAKAGDTAAAMAVTEGYVTPELVDRYKALIGDAKPIVVPVLAEEAAGRNRIPAAFAVRLAAALDLQVDSDIVQSVRAHHTAAGAYARIGNQAAFDGPVKAGQAYLILDDAVTVGGTLANLRGHIEANGGKVVGAGVLSGHPNSASIPIKAATETRLREAFGNELQTYLQEEFGFGIEHLTEGEAGHIRSARTLDELRNRIAEARRKAIDSGNAGDARRSQVEEGPRDAGLSTSGLSIARAQELKRELTKDWGDNGPSVILVENAEEFPESAKADPAYARAEGLYNGRPVVWLNVGRIPTESRFAQVLAHEAIGHYGVERVVGAEEWESIVDGIQKLASGTVASKQLQDVFADVRRRYGDLDRTTFAKESIAVMAERGIRNSFVARMLAAVRRFLRRIIPNRTWSEGDIRELLGQADSFLRAGRNAEQRAETVQAYSFSRAQIDGRGQQFLDQNGGRFVRRGEQWYLADDAGQPRDFLTRGAAQAEADRTGARIEADPAEGARRTWSVTLPNGAEISREASAFFSRVDQTETPAFKKWFGDSKVVDAAGRPRVVFHGTEADFDTFKVGDQGSFGAGIYFADTKKTAELYAPDGSRLVQAYLAMENPLRVDAEFQTGEDGWDLDSPAVGMVEKLVPEPLRTRLIERAKNDVGLFDEDLTEIIKKAGHDGIIATYEDGSTEYVVFEPNQVKSATDNSGAFSTSDSSILFSKPNMEVIDDLDAIRESLTSESVLERAEQRIRELTPAKVKDGLRQTWLGALTTRHLTELGGDYFSNIKHYNDYLAEMQADRNKLQADAEGIAERARKWAGKNREAAKAMFDVMHEATIDGVDPAEEYKVLQFRYSGQLHDATPKNVKEALNAIRMQMRERSGDNKTDMMEEAKILRGLPAREKARARKYAPLVAKWNALPPEAQQIYREFRDAYASRSDQVEAALVARINDTDADAGHKRKIIDVIRRQFESNRLQGVYFPLQRFGKYFVAAEKAGVPTFQMFERLADMARAEKGLRDRGFTITGRGLKDQGKAKDAPSGTFVAEIMEKLNKAGVSDKTQDEIYQIYLQSLPEMSMRKHAIHRKSIPGFDNDGVRAFAHNMHHGSHQLARLRFSHKLDAVLTVLKQQQKNLAKDESSDTSKIVAGDAILQELDRRHEWIMNPTDSALTNVISSAGFAYYLGLTPAASLVNLTQNALVTYPYLASRFGGIKAMNYMLAAFKDSGRTVGHIQKTLTDPDEQRAHAALQVMGALDKTQAHNLAGIAEGGMQGYNPAWSKAMEIIGWGFHKTEVINRETTGIAAYRLARAEGQSFDEAIKTASEAIWETHFDYSNANRARFMQSGTAKVLLMFRQYSLNMTWHLGRMVWQAMKGQSPEVKKIARRNLAGILGMSSIFSGVLGLPMSSVVMGTLNALQATFGDDDEPWEAETEFRAFLVDMLGEDAADVLLHGGVNAATGADIAGRVGLSEMWFRDADKELEGRGYYYSLLEQAAGPMGGVLKNAIVGKNMIDEGHAWRGVETMLPKALKDVMKAGRYATQGVNTLRGDPLVADNNLYDTLLQVNGFTPAKVASQYERNRELGNYEQHILDRRQALMDGFAMALRTGDNDARTALVGKIQAFNAKNPEVAISSAGIRRSIQARARYSAKAEAGMVINQKLKARLTAAVPADD